MIRKGKYLKQMQKLITNTDQEEAHIEADNLLCRFLEELGYTDLVAAYNKVEKWYA